MLVDCVSVGSMADLSLLLGAVEAGEVDAVEGERLSKVNPE